MVVDQKKKKEIKNNINLWQKKIKHERKKLLKKKKQKKIYGQAKVLCLIINEVYVFISKYRSLEMALTDWHWQYV